jgi:hypothetical protein
MELLLCLARRKPLDIDFERAKELIDEKQLLMHLLHFYKGGRVFVLVFRFGPL